MMDFYKGLDPNIYRNERIAFYKDKKEERERIYSLMEWYKDDVKFVKDMQEYLDNFDPWDEYPENRPDWNLVDRIGYDEIGDYIDRGLLP